MQGPRNKRQKEQARLDHQKDKAAQRAERKKIKAERPPRKPGDPDPDILIIEPEAMPDAAAIPRLPMVADEPKKG